MTIEHVHSTPKSTLSRCPYCHEGIRPEEAGLWRCAGCDAQHHLECLEEFGQCSVFGCGQPAPEIKDLSPRSQAAVKARRRARSFAARHASSPTPLGEQPPAEQLAPHAELRAPTWSAPDMTKQWAGQPVLELLAKVYVVRLVAAILLLLLSCVALYAALTLPLR